MSLHPMGIDLLEPISATQGDFSWQHWHMSLHPMGIYSLCTISADQGAPSWQHFCRSVHSTAIQAVTYILPPPDAHSMPHLQLVCLLLVGQFWAFSAKLWVVLLILVSSISVVMIFNMKQALLYCTVNTKLPTAIVHRWNWMLFVRCSRSNFIMKHLQKYYK